MALPSARIKLLSGGRRVLSSSPEDEENRPGPQQCPRPVSWFRLVRKLNDPTIKDDPAPMLSDDELRLLTSLLSCPLEPQVAVAFHSTCWSVHSASAEVIVTLKAQHLAIRRLRDALNRASQASRTQGGSWGSGSSYDALLIPTVTSFRSLDRAHWSGSGLTAADCEAVGILLRSSSLPLVSDMSFAHNPIGDAGASALFSPAQAGALPALEWLSLAQCELGDAGVASLADALGRGAMPALQALKLQCNAFGPAGAAALGACTRHGGLRGLKQLCLNDNLLLEAEGFWAALRAGALPNLVQLYYYSAALGDVGLAALARAIGGGALPALKDLFLQENSFGDAGMEALAVALGRGALPSLDCLRLESNRFGDSGLAALALALGSGGLRSLRVLFLSDSDFGFVGRGALTTALRTAARDPSVGGGALPCLANLVVPAHHAHDLGLQAACAALGVQVQGRA